MVFYPKRAFEAAGYEIPATWDELIALSNQMVADGHDPWCFDWEAGFASGFPGSDFLESLVVRVGGLDVYDGWITGEVPFDDPTIVRAAQLGNEVLFGPGLVAGGSASISQLPFQFAVLERAGRERVHRSAAATVLVGSPGVEHDRHPATPRQPGAQSVG